MKKKVDCGGRVLVEVFRTELFRVHYCPVIATSKPGECEGLLIRHAVVGVELVMSPAYSKISDTFKALGFVTVLFE